MDTSSESTTVTLEDSCESTSTYEDLNEENLQSYLSQFSFDWQLSDESEFEYATYEMDLEYEIEEQNKIEETQRIDEEVANARKAKMKKYFDYQKTRMDSIFNLRGIHFTHFNYKFIHFVFTPSFLNKKYICAHRKYHVSLKYNKKWWCLKRFQVPNKDEILKLFENTIVHDSAVMKVLKKIYESLVRVTKMLIKQRKRTHKKYLLGKDVYLTSDDEILLLTPEERKRRRERINEIWKRMLPPKAN